MPRLVPSSAQRRVQTPNATMTTLASPTLGPSDGLSMWRVEMAGGQRGPRHAFDSEQIWSVTAGRLDVALDGAVLALAPGDTIVLPAGRERQITALADAAAIVCGHGDARASVPGEDGSRGTPPWIG